MTPAIVAAGLVVVHVVHSGDFGTVLKGRRQSDGHWVAIKVVRKASLSEREHAALRKQAITLRVIRHRYIVQFFDDFEDDAFFYHVFEFLHGGDLYDRLEARGRPFSEPQVLFLARQLFYAVSYLHSRRAAHRDIKLENFVFETLPSDRRQVMKLIDFDLLVVRSASAPPVELCNNIGGTILYLSPEIASAREHVPEQSDMWACGVMLFVLLSYHMPFQGSTGRQILRAVQSTEPHFTPSIWASVSTETRQLIRDLLSKNGANRPTATQALERVKAIQALSRESQPSSKLRVLTRSLRSVSLNLWDPSGRMLRRSRNAPPNVRKGDDKDASGTTRRSQSNFPGEEPVSVNSLRSSFVLHHGAGSEAGSAPVVTDTRSDQFFGRNSALALTNFKDPRDPRPQPSVTNSEFQTPVTLSGLLARKRAGQQHRNKNDLPQIQASGSPSRSSRRLKKQSGFAMRLRNWISLSGSDSGR
ncbi:Serine/threonine protein kinase Endoplasmic reticulum [Chondrus crispus]|uniref:Serine/threonine protein kinase Endoplasmic reticulum n=1 Tax=Chondrus crispus TaxID=2769 RepID=R7QS01_CHOCR|nr:Serine/threonine protein kinase Endoplasmic reticulum [Chondrus crispus]CDF41272.1 Serine/threonine protein kinase Endoplasmic reticulum [Chondrus crispus]|eukprot:XP_005711566.1 Serine/threonine protein kinase Endoplasmic reticulum [Chondrus crispus]